MKSRFVILALVLAKMGSTAWGAEDPTRFLAVESWRGTFGQDMSVVGSRTYQQTAGGECTVDYSLVHHLNPSGVILTNWIGFGSLRYWASDGARIPNAGNVAERATLTCPEEPPSSRFHTETADRGAVQGNFLLQIDTAANQYVIQFAGIAATITVITPDGTFVGPEIGNGWGPPVTNTLPTTGLALNGSATITLDQFSRAIFLPVPLQPADLQEVLRSSALVVTWNLEPIVEDLEVVAEPSNYAKWIPKGNLKNPDRRGNSIKVSARLQKKGGGPTNVRAKALKFELVNVSKEPGVCMNFPVESPSTEPDLRFEPELNQSLNPGAITRVVSPAEVEVSDPAANIQSARAIVSSFDFGAYGKIRVTAEIDGRDPVVGHLDGDSQRSDVLLPKRQDSSFIADAWKKMPKVGAEGLLDSSDEDDRPVGDGHSGDGYSLYEEYRGFSVNRTHVYGNPHRKDLFIYDSSEGSSKPDIRKFERLSGLLIHDLLSKDEISEFNVMNINHGSNPNHLHDQTGIRMVVRQDVQGFSRAVPRDLSRRRPTTPGGTLQLEIDPAMQGAEVINFSENGAVEGYREDTSVAHEIAHACSVYHHGDEDLKRVTWVGRLSLDTPPRPLVWEFPQDRQVTIWRENGEMVDFERDVPLGTNGLKVVKPYVAVPHGQHSGDRQCIMRYGYATAYLLDASGMRYALPAKDRAADISLCTSPSSSGISATRYGDAHAKRGNCKDQICVNDKYKDDAKHDRTYPLQQW